MLTLYVIVALLALVLIVVALRRRRPQSARKGDGQAETNAVGPIPVAHRDTDGKAGGIASAAENPDPTRTMVYLRPPQASAHSVARAREGAALKPLVGAHLVCLSGSHKGASFPVVGSGITVGRDPSCAVVLTDARVSARHAWIGFIDGKALLRDLQSTNGTFLNAQTHSSVSEVELRSGDTIFFGGHQGDQFRFVAN
jgi:hypothetical protein